MKIIQFIFRTRLHLAPRPHGAQPVVCASPLRLTARLANNLLAGLCLILSSLEAWSQPATQPTNSAPIRWNELGAKAAAQYSGNGLVVTGAGAGARLNCVFQRLEGEATSEGLWLKSTAPEEAGSRFRVVATAVGRSTEHQFSKRAFPANANEPFARSTLARTGVVEMRSQVARFIRPGLVEEYSVSADGVQQDFLIEERPAGEGELRLELKVAGACAEPLADGARLALEGGVRKLHYNRLKVTDDLGRELTARMETLSTTCLVVVVDDSGAAYPVRIDPTFSDANWFSVGALSGASYLVYSAVADAAGNIYIGGVFNAVGNVAANDVAKWNGSRWSALGSGMNRAPSDSGFVYTLAVSGGDLYAGGVFTTAGGVAATNIAKWNGGSWSALASGVNDSVFALAVSGSDLYVGGNFTTAGGVAANYIAKWNGSRWSALGSGMSNAARWVSALAVSGGDLYAGGLFKAAGDVEANYIAKWDGSRWSALGSGMNAWVSSLAVSGSDLYAGGFFTTADGVAVNYIAKWNGSGWSGLDSGMNDSVSALAVSGGDLYVGGNFTTAGGVAANDIAKWNGSSWSGLASGMNDSVLTLAVTGSGLYAGGFFTTAGGVAANDIAKWDGSSWSAPGSGMNGNGVSALAVSGSDLYAGGSFTKADGAAANSIAKWNGSSWSALASGMNGSVGALAVSGSDLYAGGSFTTAGGVAANSIAKWNGSSWSALASGMNDSVFALAVSGNDLYAGGVFTTAGGVAANYVAKWNGGSWSALGSGMNDSVFALAVSGSDLYAGGVLTTAGGVAANYVAKWNGSSWSALGSGMNDSVLTLAVSGSDLYAGGSFTTAGGVAANSIAKWNGSSWSALGSGMNDDVSALAVSGSNLYAGGDFTTAGGVAANSIAKWNGSGWSALGSGMNGPVAALALSGSDLYAGGSFKTAGGKAAGYIARGDLGVSVELIYTANPVSRKYGAATPAFTGTVTGFVGNDSLANATAGTLTFTSPATSSSAVGSYPVNGSGLTANSGNYIFEQAAANATALTITELPAVLTGSRNYDGTTTVGAGILTVANLVGGDTLTLSGNVTLDGKDVGSRNLTSFSGLTLGGAAASNYTLAGASGTLTISRAFATVSLAGLEQAYDGTARSAHATTSPPGLDVVFTYDGSPNPPTNSGSYSVVGTIADPNYSGSAEGTLVIGTSFKIGGAALNGNVFTVSITTVKGFTYILQFSRLIANANWTQVQVIDGDGTEHLLQDSQATSRTRFYRVAVQRQ